MIHKKDIQNLLKYYSKDHFDKNVEKTIAFVNNNNNIVGRDNLNGHITGSAWILNSQKNRALLIHHKKLGLWFQPGGHVDLGDKAIIETSQREAIEETGLESVTPLSTNLFDLDVHLIPERKGIPEHYHYDFRFIFIAENDKLDPDFTEVNDIKWVDLEAIVNDNNYGSIQRMAQRSITTK